MADAEIASLGLVIDASQVTPAATKLDGLTAAGARAEDQANRLAASTKTTATQLAGLSDAAGKSASATASAAAAITAANDNSFRSFGRGVIAARGYGDAVAESEGRAAKAAVEGAAATVEAHKAVEISALEARETLVILKEIAEGNFTRVAGSISVMTRAIGFLTPALIPMAVAFIGAAGAMELATNQINSGVKGTGDLTRGLGLTADQLDNVKDRYVTLGDTVKAVGQEIYEALGGEKLKSGVQSVWNDIASIIFETMVAVDGAVQGAVNVIVEEWKRVPKALGGQGDWAGAGVDAAKAWASGFTSTRAELTKLFDDIAAKARANAQARIKEEAGKAGEGDSALKQAEETLRRLQDETTAQNALNTAVENGTKTIVQANNEQRVTQALATEIAKIEQDTKLSLTEKAALIDKLKAAQSGYNNSLLEYKLLQDTATGQAQLDYLRQQLSLIGATNEAEAVSLAALKARQKLEADGFDFSTASPEALKRASVYIQLMKDVAQLTFENTAALKAYNSELDYQKDKYAEIDSAAQKAAQGMTSAFGNVGNAIGSMATALTGYASQQADFAAQQAKLDKEGNTDKAAQLLLTQKINDSNNQLISDELDGFKNLFSQKSGMYKALSDIEGAYNALVLANNLAQIASNIPLIASNVATGASKMFAELGPFGFAAVAAMLAVMVGLGFSGGGGASASPADLAANDPANATNVQKGQGAGTILGDATAKSDSIQKSLDTLTKNANADLDYSNQMVVSLRSIDTHIGSLTSLLAQQIAVGGLFNTSSLKLGTSSSGVGSGIPLIGGLISSLFGSSKTTTTLLDQGIGIDPITIGKAIADGIAAHSYQTTQTTTQSSALFGLISSSKTTNSISEQALGSDFTDQITGIIAGLRSTVLQAAAKLGVDGAQAVVDSLAINIGGISLKDMTGQQIQDTLNAVFGKLGDQIATAAIPSLKQFQQVGEGAFATLSRLVSEYQAVDDAQKIVGFTFSKVGLSSLQARDNLIQLAGGIDNFQASANSFAQDFLTTAQQIAPIAGAVADAMSALGFEGVTTKAQFVSLVQSLDVSTDAGAALYTQLMAIAPAFGKVADAAQAIADKRTDLTVTLLQDQGNALAATALQRQKELAALDDSLKPLQQAIYAQEDLNAANSAAAAIVSKRTDLEIQLAQASGDAAKATALQRAQTIAGLDASLQPLQEAIFAANDLASAETELTNASNAAAQAQQNLASAQDAVASANSKVTTAEAALNKLLNPQVDTVSALANAHSKLSAAYSAESSALNNTISQFSGFANSLKSFSATLNGSGSSDPVTAYARARAAFNQLAALSPTDLTRLNGIQSAGQAFLSASQAASPSQNQFNADLAAVRAAVDQSADAAQATVDNATAQLNALNDSIAGLGVLNDSVLSVKDAIQNLADAQAADNAYQAQVKDAQIEQARNDLADAQKAQAKAVSDLADKVAALQAANDQIAANTKKVADLLTRVTQDGNSLLTTAA